jgi:two-component system cell cycle response regulator
LLSIQLSRSGYDVVEADDGFAALKAVTQHAVDVVLLDVMMAGIDGFEVCRRLKGDPDTSHIPVVLFTARDSSDTRQRGSEAGADAVVFKPVAPADLLHTIRQVM